LFKLGPIYISGLFLQQFVDSLYKAELMPCRYSTSISDNAVERRYKCCPEGSAKSVLRFVARYLLRMTKLHTSRAIKTLLSRTKINHER